MIKPGKQFRDCIQMRFGLCLSRLFGVCATLVLTLSFGVATVRGGTRDGALTAVAVDFFPLNSDLPPCSHVDGFEGSGNLPLVCSDTNCLDEFLSVKASANVVAPQGGSQVSFEIRGELSGRDCGQASATADADINVEYSFPNGGSVSINITASTDAFGSGFADGRVQAGNQEDSFDFNAFKQTNGNWSFSATLAPGGFLRFDASVSVGERLTNQDLFAEISGTVSITRNSPSTEFHWASAAGGSYNVGSNWNPVGIPVDDGVRSDIAIFDLNTGLPIPVSAAAATAGQWRFLNGTYNVTGPAQLFTPPASGISLEVANGGHARLTQSTFDTENVDIGPTSGGLSFVDVVNPGTVLRNDFFIGIDNGFLDVNSGGSITTQQLAVGDILHLGPSLLRVAGVSSGVHSSVQATGELSVGGGAPGTAGTLSVLDGAFVQADEITIKGTALVKGSETPNNPSDFNAFASLSATTSLTIGGEEQGLLTVEKGGAAQSAAVFVDAVGTGTGKVIVDGQGEFAVLNALSTLGIVATEQVEVEVKNGAMLQTQELIVGSFAVRPGAADLTIRGRTNATHNQPSKLKVLDVPSSIGPAGLTSVGGIAEGQLNILDGASATMEGGLVVGEFARGVLVVSNVVNATHPDRTSLSVTGETRVGEGALGLVQILRYSKMETHGNVKIGFGFQDTPEDSLTVDDAALFEVHGELLVGAAGVGFLKVFDGSTAICDSLLVGGNLPGGGVVELQRVASLLVTGNAQVGAGVGSGLVEIDADSMVTVNGTMTIGGPLAGRVLVNGTLTGGGTVVVVPNGRLEGNGTVIVPKVDAGGYIAPGLSPGTLTIDGDLEILPGGALVIEYEGLGAGQFDVLHVTGDTTLSGRLEVHFRDGFSPANPAAFIQSQDFVEADQGITGDYTERIYAFPDLFADFDNDDDKDLEDVAEFMNCFGLSGGGLQPNCDRADWEDNGVLNEVEVRELSSRLSGPS